MSCCALTENLFDLLEQVGCPSFLWKRTEDTPDAATVPDWAAVVRWLHTRYLLLAGFAGDAAAGYGVETWLEDMGEAQVRDILHSTNLAPTASVLLSVLHLARVLHTLVESRPVYHETYAPVLQFVADHQKEMFEGSCHLVPPDLETLTPSVSHPSVEQLLDEVAACQQEVEAMTTSVQRLQKAGKPYAAASSEAVSSLQSEIKAASQTLDVFNAAYYDHLKPWTAPTPPPLCNLGPLASRAHHMWQRVLQSMQHLHATQQGATAMQDSAQAVTTADVSGVRAMLASPEMGERTLARLSHRIETLRNSLARRQRSDHGSWQ